MGKKQNEWNRERKKRLKELEATGKYEVEGHYLYGNCKDCGEWHVLDLDHIDGRGGLDPHRMDNLDPICRRCHIKRHNNMSKKKKRKKANWEVDHPCKHCKKVISILLCNFCGKISV